MRSNDRTRSNDRMRSTGSTELDRSTAHRSPRDVRESAAVQPQSVDRSTSRSGQRKSGVCPSPPKSTERAALSRARGAWRRTSSRALEDDGERSWSFIRTRQSRKRSPSWCASSTVGERMNTRTSTTPCMWPRRRRWTRSRRKVNRSIAPSRRTVRPLACPPMRTWGTPKSGTTPWARGR